MLPPTEVDAARPTAEHGQRLWEVGTALSLDERGLVVLADAAAEPGGVQVEALDGLEAALAEGALVIDGDGVVADPWLTSYLAGAGGLSRAVESLTVPLPAVDGRWCDEIVTELTDRSIVLEVVSPRGGLAPAFAAAASRQLGLEPVGINLDGVDSDALVGQVIPTLFLQARLLGLLPVLLADDPDHVSRAVWMTLQARDWPVVVVTDQRRRLHTPREPFATLEIPGATVEDRRRAWEAVLPDDVDRVPVDVDRLAMVPIGVLEMHEAWTRAVSDPQAGSLGTSLLHHAQSLLFRRGSGLARLRIPSDRSASLVLPDDVAARLDDFALAASRHAGLPPQRQQGVRALFAGPSGTGKTAMAESLGGRLGLPLLFVEVSRVVDKYIGETEKNLDRVLDDAERANALLVFDEGESLFGNRTAGGSTGAEASNRQVAYLLARLEQHRGLVIVASNYPGAIDVAFLRRFHFFVGFKVPPPDQRAEMWAKTLARHDLDPPSDLRRFGELELAGGNVANVCYLASLLAPADGGPIDDLLARLAHDEFVRLRRQPPASITR